VPTTVTGLRELSAAFAHAERQTRLGFRAGLRDVAEPVRRDAEQLALSAIPRMSASPAWSRMRTGVTRSLVYVAPRKRGTRGRTPRSRPNLADLLMDKAMEPALERHANEIEGRMEQFMDHIADDFNH
jgi:hypothetical protein